MPSNNQKNKGKKNKPGSQPPTEYMFPALHPQVLQLLREDGMSHLPDFNPSGEEEEATKHCTTFIRADFRCYAKGCGKPGWGSGKVCILIQKFPDNSYNAIVYNQRCKSCGKLGKMEVDKESYVARVVYRLKKWSGMPMEKVQYDERVSRGPHLQELCEGCRKGRCKIAEMERDGEVGELVGRMRGLGF
ncbi:zinc-binding domain-containing protein [Podospora fimiseda]|uniref:Zinc-binding domain-containing protein n=1 Tax=Podospora fimiseda TaxID=252190 RepID=A0AAN6YNV4_9PEZI|nr:zinc-binding domain-containing protein [Podospora fimiseda]